MPVKLKNHPLFTSHKPWTRWWWFSGEIPLVDIDNQLAWIKNQGFGGVEIAWVYPLPRSRKGHRFLSPEWSSLLVHTKKSCNTLGLGCDFTFGTLWPFGGSMVEERDALQVYGGLSGQRLTQTWEDPFVENPSFIINHLDRNSLLRYSNTVGNALRPALDGFTSALFCDSWEVEPDKLWTDGFGERFETLYGYKIEDYIENIYDHPEIMYDYRKLLAEYVLDEFYKPFHEVCRNLGGISRVQCHGAPTDLLAAYGTADIPESESLLYEPYFSKFAASAAALTGKKIVSCETFTCLYGWKPRPGPAPYGMSENPADLKLLADAVFANGVNRIIWHGMPFNGEGQENQFYATVHVGRTGKLADHIKPLNEYMEKVSEFMSFGRTYTDIAVYMPIEDAWMQGKYPDHLYFVDPQYHYEFRYLETPEELNGWQPLWISGSSLKTAKFDNGLLKTKVNQNFGFRLLYVDIKWLDETTLDAILSLALSGLPICLKRFPKQPGHVITDSFHSHLAALTSLPNVNQDFGDSVPVKPLLEFDLPPGTKHPDFWCRTDVDKLIIFFANPKTKEVTYPMKYGQSLSFETVTIPVRINWGDLNLHYLLFFEPYQSLLIEITGSGGVVNHDINYLPPTPSVG